LIHKCLASIMDSQLHLPDCHTWSECKKMNEAEMTDENSLESKRFGSLTFGCVLVACSGNFCSRRILSMDWRSEGVTWVVKVVMVTCELKWT